jgi:hypothetical protein
MNKFKQTLKIIEEGLLKPMSAADIEQVDAEKVKERVDEILSRSTKNPDGSIDVDGEVQLNNLKLTKLPLKFNKVNGNFYCYYNKLTTLEGSPNKVDGSFDCEHNDLISLDGCPTEVSGDFACYDNIVLFTKEQVRAVCDVKGDIIV